MSNPEIFEMMKNSVMEGDSEQAASLGKKALGMGITPGDAIEKGFTPGIQKMGEMWEEGEVFLPELVLSAEAMKNGIDVLRPELERRNEKAPNLGTVVIGTIQGDIHDIGKSLVASLLSATGFQVFDLGVDVAPEKFVEEAVSKKAAIIGMSALLTTTMLGQKKVIDILTSRGIRKQFKVLVGGAPVSRDWAREIGADAAPAGAMEAVQTAREMAKALV
jgi:trimethylamine corrinoid protein